MGSHALVVSESCYGNTSAVAEAIAEGLRIAGATVQTVPASSSPSWQGVDLMVIGAPTHNRHQPNAHTRQKAARDGGAPAGPGVTEWLTSVPIDLAVRCVLFDTVTGRSVVNGSAAKAVARQLHRARIEVTVRESFLVEGVKGPLVAGELERARTWGATLLGPI